MADETVLPRVWDNGRYRTATTEEAVAVLADDKARWQHNWQIEREQAVRWERLAERLAWHLSDALAVLKANRIKIVPTYGDDGTKALADFRALIPSDRTIPRDYK